MRFADIAVLITDIHRNYFNINSFEDIPISIISEDKTKRTYYNYILDTVKEIGIESIDIKRLDYKKEFILGRFMRWENHAEVWISAELNTCWSRYVTAKELSHLIIDKDKEVMTLDIERTIEWMLKMDMPYNIDKALDSEHIAAQFAIELLVPYKLSKPLLHDKNKSSYEIASIFSVPERLIDAIRQKDYSALRDEAYKDL